MYSSKRSYRVTKKFISLATVLVLCGCQTTVNNQDFLTTTAMSDTIWLSPVSNALKTVFIDIRNTSGIDKCDINQDIRQALISRGYSVVDDPERAYFILQANLLSLVKQQNGTFSKVNGSGALVGGVAGAAIGAGVGNAMGSNTNSTLAGAGLVGLFGSVIGAAIEHANAGDAQAVGLFQLNVNIMVSEKSKNVMETSDPYSGISYRQGKGGSVAINFKDQTNRKKYQTDLSVRTNSAMSLDKAVPLLKSEIVKAISGIF